MVSKIILIGNISDIDIIPHILFNDKNTKIFSFDFETHQKLQSKKIPHEIADDILTQDERLKLFDHGSKLLTWYSQISSHSLEYENVNLLKLFDSHEFISYLMPTLSQIKILLKIIDRENPSKIIGTNSLSNIIESIIKSKQIETKIFQSKIENKLLWDKITLKYNIGVFPITINLSKKNYFRIKNFYEKILGHFFNILFKINHNKKKAIVFLEFNTQLFSKFFNEMKNYDGDIILVNQRRPAIWNKNSIDIIKKSNCKIFKPENILNKDEKSQVLLSVNEFSKKFNNFWENSIIFNDIFQLEGYCFWNIVKEVLIKILTEELHSKIMLIQSIKKISNSIDVKCLVSLNESGVTEKTFLEFYKNTIPSILLEHGFIERIDKTKRYDVFSGNSSFNDKTAVWGETKKEWIVNEYNVDPTKILVSGSPRHDEYFDSIKKKKNRRKKILLLAPNPINDVNGLSSTGIKIRFNSVIKNIFSIVKKFDDVKIIVKLHPIQLKHNEEIKSFINKLEPTAPIYLWTSVIDTINNADAVVVLSPEIHATPTMLLESMILGKPTMNIYFDNEIPEYEHVQSKAILTVLDNCDLENNLRKIIFDAKFQNTLKTNADTFLSKFLSYKGCASERFASILKSY